MRFSNNIYKRGLYYVATKRRYKHTFWDWWSGKTYKIEESLKEQVKSLEGYNQKQEIQLKEIEQILNRRDETISELIEMMKENPWIDEMQQKLQKYESKLNDAEQEKIKLKIKIERLKTKEITQMEQSWGQTTKQQYFDEQFDSLQQQIKMYHGTVWALSLHQIQHLDVIKNKLDATVTEEQIHEAVKEAIVEIEKLTQDKTTRLSKLTNALKDFCKDLGKDEIKYVIHNTIGNDKSVIVEPLIQLLSP
eukprot:115934_1